VVALESGETRIPTVQSQAGLSLSDVRTMALQAVHRENRADVPIEIDDWIGGGQA
jgi:hypothetical protein